MKILSLDLSTKSSGWAIFENSKLVNYGCITSNSTDLIKRIKVMTENIKNIIEENKDIDKIIAEEVRPQGGFGVGNLKTHRALMYLQASIVFMLYDNYKNIEGKIGLIIGADLIKDFHKWREPERISEKPSHDTGE